MLREVILGSKIMNSFYFLPYSFSFCFQKLKKKTLFYYKKIYMI